jgi:putative ABC transport system permease protein
MIKLDKVNKYYYRGKPNQIHVIDNTSMEIPEKGILTLLGPSGCGKTTLLNAIGGLDRIDSGSITIDDDCITKRSASKKDDIRNAKIGYIFQNFNLLDDRTVFENVAIALRMVGIKDKQIIKERVNYCLRAVGIYQYRNKNANALSGGQRQRVAIARAIVKNPRIIIADEPTGNLDSANTIEVMNVIKKISKERIVILVTHERKIAEFYSDYICELKDGKIVEAYNNDSSKYLDYQLENKIYLKDMPVSKSFNQDGVNLGIYSDEEREANINIVIRGGNLYIDTDGKFNIVGEDSNVELIDDHYRAMDESIYADNSFEYDAHLPENFKAKYTSIYTIGSLFSNGFKTIMGFKKLKKFLLIGFVFAAIFAFTGVSHIMGVLDVEPKDYLTTNDHYLTVANGKHSTDLINQLKEIEGVDYVVPGTTAVALELPMDDYIQTSSSKATINASVTRLSTIDESKLILGRMPENDHELVLDKMLIDDFIENKKGTDIALNTVEGFEGRIIKVPNLSDYTIVGVSDTGSPSVYVDDNQVELIITNANKADSTSEGFGSEYENTEQTDKILNYSLAPSTLKIKKGRAPSADYEVLANYSHYGEYELNKNISKKMNGVSLKVVGFYQSDTTDDIYYVTANTVYLDYVGSVKQCSVYTSQDISKMSEKLQDAGYSVEINSVRDKDKYLSQMKSTLKASLAVAGVLLLISLVEMYLMLRSSFLARIKEVGIMRAIGLKKKDIYRMFAGEILVITTVTAIPGIALAYYIMSNIIKITAYLQSVYMVNLLTAVVSFGLLLIFNLIAGLLPVFRTMRKTPAEILARTDI